MRQFSMPALVGALSLAMVGCGGPSTGTSGTGSPPANGGTPGGAKTADLATATPDASMTATEYFKAVKADPKMAREKYEGKVVELTGEVWTVTSPFNDGVCVILATDEKLKVVYVYTSDKMLWERVGAGAKVTIRGTPTSSHNMIRPAAVISVASNPAPTYQAVELAKEVAADSEAADKKYRSKSGYVIGELVRFQPSKNGGDLILKGSGDVEVQLGVGSDDVAAAKALKPGAKVKAHGELLVMESGGKGGKGYMAVTGALFKAE